MGGQLTEKLAPSEDLRPAQLGIILVGRVIVGHLGATLIDLCQRGFLRIDEIPNLAPYMMIFGLAAAPGVDAGIRDDAASQRSGEIPWARLDVFTVAWGAWVNESCGSDAHGRSDDFAHQWHAPAGHDHGNPGHHSGYHGYGGGHGGFGGGHGHGHGGPI